MSRFITVALIIFCSVIISFSMRGILGNPRSSELLNKKWQFDGPFELSPERGRFALAYSIAEENSFYFSGNIAKFANPDVAISNGKFVSLFAPALSFLVIPGYIIGKFFGASQVGAFGVVSIFAILNVLLIRSIATRLGANKAVAIIAGLIFLFATPAFTYAVNLYQHHISTFLILLSIYVLLKSNKIWSLAVVFFLCAAAIPLDYPNLFFMLPIGIFALGRIISVGNLNKKLSVKINIFKIPTPIIMIIPLLFFLWFNQMSYGNPFQLSGTLPTSKQFNIEKLSSEEVISQIEKKRQENLRVGKTSSSAINFFTTRSLLNGFYIHFISPDRGVIYYAPVVLFGIIGFLLALKKKVKMTPLLAAIVGANILLYSMWGDPQGGWAFGSRYLIPSYAILSIFIALLLTYWRRKTWFFAIFIPVAFYSIAVNTLGAITTSAMPPQVEVLNLEKLSGLVQKYTWERNWDFLLDGHSKSFAYQTFLRNFLTPLQFYQILTLTICLVVGGILFYFILISKKRGSENA